MSLFTKEQMVKRSIDYANCNKCGKEKSLVDRPVATDGWMTCVKLDKETEALARMEIMLNGNASSYELAKNSTQHLCDTCSVLFEEFVRKADIVVGKEGAKV